MKRRSPSLPHILYAAAEAGGPEAVLKLAKAIGGRRFYIPSQPPPRNHPLVLAAGQKVADAVVKVAGGRLVDFPKGAHAVHTMMAAKIIADGGTNEDIRAATGITYRTAARLRAQLKQGLDWGRLKGLKVERSGRGDPRQIDIDEWLAQS